MSSKAVFGLYASRLQVERAVDTLRAAGFRPGDVSVLMPTDESTKDFAHEKNTKAPEGTAAGGLTGGLAGGTLGWLAGIGAFAIPGLGPLVAAGPIVAMLTGVGVGAAVGGLTGALVGLGIPEFEAKRYEGLVRGGRILLSVHADDPNWRAKATAILEATGAEDVASASEPAGDIPASRMKVR